MGQSLGQLYGQLLPQLTSVTGQSIPDAESTRMSRRGTIRKRCEAATLWHCCVYVDGWLYEDEITTQWWHYV